MDPMEVRVERLSNLCQRVAMFFLYKKYQELRKITAVLPRILETHSSAYQHRACIQPTVNAPVCVRF